MLRMISHQRNANPNHNEISLYPYQSGQNNQNDRQWDLHCGIVPKAATCDACIPYG